VIRVTFVASVDINVQKQIPPTVGCSEFFGGTIIIIIIIIIIISIIIISMLVW